MKAAGALLLLLACTTVQAQEAPAQTVREIAFEGNDTTQPRTLLRELPIAVGDPADAAQVERSRQAIQDLGLFKTVSVREEPVEGGVRLVFKVRERWYILPTPRVDAKAGGEYSYGAQLQWNNLWGLDHTLRVIWEREDTNEAGVGLQTNHAFSYSAPQVFDSRYSVGVSASEVVKPTDLAGGGSYEETLQSLSLGVSRSLSDSGPPSQGWSAGAGLGWLNQETDGPGAPPAYGSATAPFATLSYRDLHLHIYSEEGVSFRSSLQGAVDGLASDYGFLTYNGRYARYMHVGATDHQTLHLIAELGARIDGPPENDAYFLGGDSLLRGYDKEFVEGDAVYRVSAEFARPLHWRWLRWVLIAEAGNAFERPQDFSLSRIYTSVGAGLRLRLSWFVNVEIEAGVAIPVGDSGGTRFFAGGV
ncbi:BamA/TamA family outer membrane protein [Solimonas sp. K1W22B-7]|uniref:BamA/TamA family outer membrane protein n=1 Tax=Solimonas sp. K1W22B-7 TaxID=2303331 RepID=UPI0013C516BC|nr:BamA/TamA family outer membrane protein [Solimonas sp. K1W22B-7]